MGNQRVRFAPEATRWLGIWLDPALTLRKNRRRRLYNARQAAAKIRRTVNQPRVPPAAARSLQIALAQCAMLYVAELIWGGRSGVKGEYQQAINRIARSTLGAFQSTL